MCKYEQARVVLVKEGLCPKLHHYGICKFSLKESQTSTSNPSSYIKDHMAKNILLWVDLAIWPHLGAPQKLQEKLYNSQLFHLNLELHTPYILGFVVNFPNLKIIVACTIKLKIKSQQLAESSKSILDFKKF
jgi:hypothetical protein